MQQHLTRLRKAAGVYDWADVHAACADFVHDVRSAEQPPPIAVWTSVLKLLRATRRYDDLVTVADALAGAGVSQPVIRRYLALSLADRGAPAMAQVMFEHLVAEARAVADDGGRVDGEDLAEAEGGVARCAKDLFLTTRAPSRRARYLDAAYHGYRQTYDRDPKTFFWQGINAVALAARAARDELPITGVPDPAREARQLAAAVLATTESIPDGNDPWPAATACEACMALGEYEQAHEQAQAFLEHPDTGAFHINALLRQFTDVWQLDPHDAPGAGLLLELRSRLLQRDGVGVQISARDVVAERAATQEKVFGGDRFKTLRWYLEGLECCRAVCRIVTTLDQAVGTGFLITRESLGLAGPGLALVTNAHVVESAVPFEEAVAVFEGIASGADAPRTAITGVLWTSPEGALDTSVLALAEPPDVTPVTPAGRLPNLGAETTPRAYIIGHPLGLSQPQFSLQDNVILDYDDTRLHYRSPTDHGSSGSPVFNDKWQLIGLHHEGSDTTRRLHGRPGVYQANEAIVFAAIRAEILRSGGTPGPA